MEAESHIRAVKGILDEGTSGMTGGSERLCATVAFIVHKIECKVIGRGVAKWLHRGRRLGGDLVIDFTMSAASGECMLSS